MFSTDLLCMFLPANYAVYHVTCKLVVSKQSTESRFECLIPLCLSSGVVNLSLNRCVASRPVIG